MEATNEKKYGNAYSFTSIIPPLVGTTFYRELEFKGMGGGIERGIGIKYGVIIYK